MMSANPLVNGSAIVAALEDVGFVKRTSGILTFDLQSNVLGWMGLNRASRGGPKGQATFHPVAGLHHPGLEKLLQELKSFKQPPYTPASVAIPLRYLMPVSERVDWIVQSVPEVDELVAHSLAAAAKKYAIPYYRAHATLELVVEELEVRPTTTLAAQYGIPAALWLLGRPEDALRRLALERENVGPGTGAWQVQYQRFAERLRERIESEG